MNLFKNTKNIICTCKLLSKTRTKHPKMLHIRTSAIDRPQTAFTHHMLSLIVFPIPPHVIANWIREKHICKLQHSA